MSSSAHARQLVNSAAATMGRVAPISCPPDLHGDMKTLQYASNILDLMEKYTQALNDPTRTLKSIQPIVEDMLTELNGLTGESSTHSEELASLVNEIAVAARVETIKFQRGDYIL